MSWYVLFCSYHRRISNGSGRRWRRNLSAVAPGSRVVSFLKRSPSKLQAAILKAWCLDSVFERLCSLNATENGSRMLQAEADQQERCQGRNTTWFPAGDSIPLEGVLCHILRHPPHPWGPVRADPSQHLLKKRNLAEGGKSCWSMVLADRPDPAASRAGGRRAAHAPCRHV